MLIVASGVVEVGVRFCSDGYLGIYYGDVMVMRINQETGDVARCALDNDEVKILQKYKIDVCHYSGASEYSCIKLE